VKHSQGASGVSTPMNAERKSPVEDGLHRAVLLEVSQTLPEVDVDVHQVVSEITCDWFRAGNLNRIPYLRVVLERQCPEPSVDIERALPLLQNLMLKQILGIGTRHALDMVEQ